MNRPSLRVPPALLALLHRVRQQTGSLVRRCPTPRRPPLPITGAVILVLLLLPAVGLLRWPRPRAEGLEKLMATASLLQSFPATPDRPLPALWQERLDPAVAERLWRQQRRHWWQFWGSQAGGPAYLALPASSILGVGGRSLPPNALRLDDLVIYAPDLLSRELLADQLRSGQRRSRGLERECLERLEGEQAVFWNPVALGVMMGPLSQLLQLFQEGCLLLDLQPDGVRWQGEAAAADGALARFLEPPPAAPTILWPELSPDQLLVLEGSNLEPLLVGLLATPPIREPLSSRYGIGEAQLPLLRKAPFRLRLRPLLEGPFRASLEAQLVVSQRKDWETMLSRLADSLRQQGLLEAGDAGEAGDAMEAGADPPLPPQPAQPPPRPSAEAAVWRRPDGVVVGGWRWVRPSIGDPELLFFLGPDPGATASAMGRGARNRVPGQLRLSARPSALANLGLLPQDLPVLVKRADQLWLEAAPLPGAKPVETVNQLTGRLRVSP